MLSTGTSTFDLILWHLTGYYYIWHLYYIIYSWLLLLRGLDMIIILLPDIWYSWTPVLLNSCIPYTHVSCTVTLVARSYRRPVEHAWRRDNKDVSHDHASVRRILNRTECHTEQSPTPHTWWEPPLESVGATSRIHPPQSKVPHGTKCHITYVVGATSWICGGHLLNL